MKKKQVKKTKNTALVISELSLTEKQTAVISAPTPPQFIKRRAIRGHKEASYVEAGYFTAKLNQVFGPLNWSWNMLEHGETPRKLDRASEGEVWVRGRLTILDHKNGYQVSKDGFGQHPIYPGVPFGDALKAASSDAFKKACAQGLGICLDVYWPQEEAPNPKEVEVKPKPVKDLFSTTLALIKREENVDILAQLRERIRKTQHLTQEQKEQLVAEINKKC